MKQFLRFCIILLFSLKIKAQVPTATIVGPALNVCSGSVLTFTTITANSPEQYNWVIIPSASVTVFPDRSNSYIDLTFPKGGVYTLSLQVSNATGTTSTTQSFTINQTAFASFNASLTNVGYPTQMILTNYSTGGISNQWLFNDDPTTFVSYSATKDYTAAGSYSITLIEYGKGGCNDTLSYAFRISDSSSVTLPNIFTPNNDSINDIYRPIARGIQSMNVWIYNRYGTLVFNWDRPMGFWDGFTSSGEPCDAGVYFCVVEATGFDGKSYKLKGSINLSR